MTQITGIATAMTQMMLGAEANKKAPSDTPSVGTNTSNASITGNSSQGIFGSAQKVFVDSFQTVSDTASGTAEAVKNVFIGKRDSNESSFNTNSSNSSGFFDGINSQLSSVATWINDQASTAYETAIGAGNGLKEAISYSNLEAKGAELADAGVAHLNDASAYLGNTSFANSASRAYKSASEKISEFAEGVKNSTPTPGSWLPVAIVGTSIFTSYKAGKAAAASYQEGSFKKAAVQIFASVASASLGAAVALQSPVGQNVQSSLNNFFKGDN